LLQVRYILSGPLLYAIRNLIAAIITILGSYKLSIRAGSAIVGHYHQVRGIGSAGLKAYKVDATERQHLLLDQRPELTISITRKS
jgi:hypothetical protein